MNHRNRVFRFAAAVCTLFSAFQGLVFGNPLSYFEQRARNSPQAVGYAADSLALSAQIGHLRSSTGPSLGILGNAGASHDIYSNYRGGYGGGAITFQVPLTGARFENRAQIDRLKLEIQDVSLLRKIAEAAVLAGIRTNYYRYWNADRKLEHTTLFLQSQRQVDAVLKLRTQRGYVLESDRLEFMTAYDFGKRNLVQFQQEKEIALRALNFLCGDSTAHFEPVAPKFPGIPPSMPNLQAEATSRIATPLENPGNTGLLLRTVESSVGISGSMHKYFDATIAGDYHAFVALDIPLNAGARLRSRQQEAFAARLRRHQQNLQLSAEANGKIADLYNSYQIARSSYQLGENRVHSSREKIRISFLRAGFAEGDMIEKLVQAHRECYMATIEMLDAQERLYACAGELHARLAVAGYKDLPPNGDFPLPQPCISGPVLRLSILDSINTLPAKGRSQKRFQAMIAENIECGQDNSSLAGTAGSLNALVWDFDKLSVQDSSLWSTLSGLGIDRIAISFSSGVFDSLRTDKSTADRVSKILAKATKNGIRTELLLGEARWMLPQYRQHLLSTLSAMEGLGFFGLCFDLEPNQLDSTLDEEKKLLLLYETLKETKAVIHKPFGVLLHPRYVDMPAGGMTFGESLREIAPAYIGLMIYSAKTETILQRTRDAIEKHPQLTFRTVISVEPPPILSPEESFYGAGKSNFQKAVHSMLDGMKDYPTFTGIAVQSWEYLKEMKP